MKTLRRVFTDDLTLIKLEFVHTDGSYIDVFANGSHWEVINVQYQSGNALYPKKSSTPNRMAFEDEVSKFIREYPIEKMVSDIQAAGIDV